MYLHTNSHCFVVISPSLDMSWKKYVNCIVKNAYRYTGKYNEEVKLLYVIREHSSPLEITHTKKP